MCAIFPIFLLKYSVKYCLLSVQPCLLSVWHCLKIGKIQLISSFSLSLKLELALEKNLSLSEIKLICHRLEKNDRKFLVCFFFYLILLASRFYQLMLVKMIHTPLSIWSLFLQEKLFSELDWVWYLGFALLTSSLNLTISFK